MKALTVFPLSFSCPFPLRTHHHSVSKTKTELQLQRLPIPIIIPAKPVNLITVGKFRHTLVIGAVKCSASGDPREESALFDENGAVDDMDGYLNYLSLEYDSVWDTKPSWCQPWTISLTGVLIIACSWMILHSVLATAVVLSIICIWWYIFLYSYPKAYSDMIAERRKKVVNGVQDTSGWRKSQ